MKKILILLFIVCSQIGFAQLIDPFGKVITHEIKLEKLDNGMYAGAMEWTTGGLDSLQKFVIKGLSVKAPVMVRIISKAPDHNIDLTFHKSGWDKIESKIATNGEKFAHKTFRTMNNVGVGVSSKVAGIPYLISVKVGLQFPSTKSLVRFTNDKEEYTNHMRKMGYMGKLFEDGNNSSNSDNSSLNGNNNMLTYIVIALLIIIIILIALFLLKRKNSKHTTTLLFFLTVGQFCFAQSSQPKPVPIGESGVFLEYRTSNVRNQVPVVEVMNVGYGTIDVAVGTSLETRLVRIDTAPGVEELTGAAAAEVLRRIKEANEQFDSDYGSGSPGEPTQGDQRTLPTDRNAEEIEQLRRQVRRLQQQVAELTPEDEEFDTDDSGDEVLIFCEDPVVCQQCVDLNTQKLNAHIAYFSFLQRFYLKEVTDLNDKIDFGNALSSSTGSGLAWGPILRNNIRPAMNNLKTAYNNKFDEYIKSIESDYKAILECTPNQEANNAQIANIINQLKASRITK